MNLGNKFTLWYRFYNNTLLQKIIIFFLTVICLPLIIIYTNSNSHFTDVNKFMQDINGQFNNLVNDELPEKNSEMSIKTLQEKFNTLTIRSQEAISDIKSQNLMLMILSLVLAGLLTALLLIKLNRHFKQFKRAFAEIRQGNFSHKIDVNTQDEFAQLAQHFNEVMQNLQTADKSPKSIPGPSKEFTSKKKEYDDLINRLAYKQQEINKLIHLSLASPESPEIPEIKISGQQNPQGLGGYYFFMSLPDKKLGFIMLESDKNDIAGHFLINFIMLFSKEELARASTIRNFYKNLNQRIQDIVSRFNIKISAFFSIIDLKRFTLTFVNSGFKNPVFFSCNGKGLQFISANGSQLLGTDAGNCKLETLKLNKGDRLLLLNRDINEETQKKLNKIKVPGGDELKSEASFDYFSDKAYEILDYDMKDMSRIFFEFRNQSSEKNDKNSAYFEEGTHYFLNKQYDLALDAFNKVRGVDAYHIKALSSIGFIHYKQKEYKQAKDVWEEVLKHDPAAMNIKKNLEVLEKQMEEEQEIVI